MGAGGERGTDGERGTGGEIATGGEMVCGRGGRGAPAGEKASPQRVSRGEASMRPSTITRLAGAGSIPAVVTCGERIGLGVRNM